MLDFFLKNLLLESKFDKANAFFLFDKRYKNEIISSSNIKHKFIKNREIERIKFYYTNSKNINFCFCFSNFPPPKFINCRSLIYFQNLTLLNSRNLKNTLKRSYLKFLVNKNQKFIFQTNNTKEIFNKNINSRVEKVIFPFFENKLDIHSKEKRSNTYFYPAAFTKNKNHKLLIESFLEFAKHEKSLIYLYLTLKDEEFKILLNKKIIPKNLRIINLGYLSTKDTQVYLSKSKFLIFPSIEESFGLPLIEATIIGTKVIASDLDYCNEIINPSLKFNPFDKTSLYKTLIESINYKTIPFSNLKIKNQIEDLLKLIEIENK